MSAKPHFRARSFQWMILPQLRTCASSVESRMNGARWRDGVVGFFHFLVRAEKRAPNEHVRARFFIQSFTFAAFAFWYTFVSAAYG
jgi:hypothetical protein